MTHWNDQCNSQLQCTYMNIQLAVDVRESFVLFDSMMYVCIMGSANSV